MNVNPIRCRYCQKFFCCEAHKIDHEVKHHKKPSVSIWEKNRNFAIHALASKSINNIKNKQKYNKQIKEYGTTEEKTKCLSRKRPHSFIKTNENKESPAVLFESATLLERKILKPKYKKVKIVSNENNMKVPKKEMSKVIQTNNDVTINNKETRLLCVNKKPHATDKKLYNSVQKEINEINKDNPLVKSVSSETDKVSLQANASDKSQQDIIEEVLIHSLHETNLLVQNVLHTESYYEITKQNIFNENIESPLISINKETSIIIVSPVSDGGTPPGKTSTPVQYDMSLNINDNWYTTTQNSSLSIYKTPVEQYSETAAEPLMSPKEAESNLVKHNPSGTPLRGIMKNSKCYLPGNETLNSTSSLSKLRHVTFSDTLDSHLTQDHLSNDTTTQSTTSDNLQLHSNSMFKTMADFVTSSFQSLQGIIASSFDNLSNTDMKFKVKKTAKRIRSPDTESSTGYSPSHKRRCYHCYLKENPISKRRSISVFSCYDCIFKKK